MLACSSLFGRHQNCLRAVRTTPLEGFATFAPTHSQRLDECHPPLLEEDSAAPSDSISVAIAVSPHWDVTAPKTRGIMVAEVVGLKNGKVARRFTARAHWSHDLAGKIR